MFTTHKASMIALLTALFAAGCDPPDELGEDEDTAAEPETDGSSGEDAVGGLSLDTDDFSAPEPDPYAAAHLCIDACSEQVSCWTSCVKAGKTTNCLQSGYGCDSGQVCGNMVCDLHEDCSSCPDDCKPKPIVTSDYESTCAPTGLVLNQNWKYDPTPSPGCPSLIICGNWQMKCTTYKITDTTVCWDTTQTKKAVESHFEYQYSCGSPWSFESSHCD